MQSTKTSGPVPVWGGILVGGVSRRMGRPKADLRFRGLTFFEIVSQAMEDLEGPVVLGERSDTDHIILPDVAGIGGPLAGLLSAMRWQPSAAWVFAACDLPLVERSVIQWLVEQRRSDRQIILPRTDGRVHPLLALYEPTSLASLERLAAGGYPALSSLQDAPGVFVVEPPARLVRCWTNVNTPTEMKRLETQWPSELEPT